MNETSPDSSGPPLKGRKPKPRQGRKKGGGTGETEGKKISRGITPNPHCDCSPCTCLPPCTCGLELTATEIRTEWSDEDDQLVYSVSEIWTPKDGGKQAG